MIRLMGWFLAVYVQASQGSREPSEWLVPRGWEGNPWGPAITAAREAGEVPQVTKTTEMQERDRWALDHIQDGDVLFRRGDARILFGHFPFSRFIANATNSPYSHTGIAAVEDGQVVVYDTTKFGPRRQPFSVWMIDSVGPFGIKRLKPQWRDRVPQVLAYCRQAFQSQVPFDFNLSPDDRGLYCVEMTEKAYRAAGLPLSNPVLLGDMERAAEYPMCMFGLMLVSQHVLDEPLSFEMPVYFPGNTRHGIWSAPVLETVHYGLDTPSGDDPAVAGPLVMPRRPDGRPDPRQISDLRRQQSPAGTTSVTPPPAGNRPG